MDDLFASPPRLLLDPGAVMLGDFATDKAPRILTDIMDCLSRSPLRQMETPGGRRIQVHMSNCGAAGWISDRQGYRYAGIDPVTNNPWPAIPQSLLDLAQAAALAAGYPNFLPDACLINRYAAGTGMGLHQDKNERDESAPIVSVSLGLPAVFLWGGALRQSPIRPIMLNHGDVLVWGGPSRYYYHGIRPIKPGQHPQTGPYRFNLTFRQAL